MRSLAKLAVITAIGAAGVCFALPAFAASTTWEHNGSRVSLEENGDKRTITFAEPKAGLDKSGVRRGTVLFSGQVKKDGRLSGYAKIFKAGCDPVDYFVEGAVDSSKGEIVLQGQAPVYSGNECRIKGYSEDSKDSTLVFRGRGGGTYAGGQPVEQGDGGYDARGQRDQRTGQEYDGNGSQRDSGSGQRQDAYASRGNGQADEGDDGQQADQSGRYSGRQDDDRRNDERRYGNGSAYSRDYADRGRDYDPRDARARDDQQYDEQDEGADDEYTTYRYRTYRRTYERPYQPGWRY